MLRSTVDASESSYKAVRVLTLLQFPPAIRTVPLGATWWQLCEVDTIEMEPLFLAVVVITSYHSSP